MSAQTKFGSKPLRVPSGTRPVRKKITPQDPSWPFPPITGPVPPKRKTRKEKLDELDVGDACF